jgi:sterol desaturase/sphingolipid hydroxylase (fatty acid hydroxylase superfamily)
VLQTLWGHFGVAVAALSLGMMWEVWTRTERDEWPELPDLLGDLGYAFLNIVLVTPVSVVILTAMEPHVRVSRSLAIHPLLGLVIGFFVFEGITYALHRWWHSSPRLMRFHQVHHTPHVLHCLVAFRMHPVDVFAFTILGNLPLVAMGMPSWGGVYVIMAERAYATMLHASHPFKLRSIGGLFASGAFHHVHHEPFRGKSYNFGGALSVFDRLFGTAAPEPVRAVPHDRSRAHNPR